MSPGTKKLLMYGGGAASIIALVVLFYRARSGAQAQASADNSGLGSSVDSALLPYLATMGTGSGGLDSLVSGNPMGSGGNAGTINAPLSGACISAMGTAGTYDASGNCVANPVAPPPTQVGVTSGTVVTATGNADCVTQCKKFGLGGHFNSAISRCTCI